MQLFMSGNCHLRTFFYRAIKQIYKAKSQPFGSLFNKGLSKRSLSRLSHVVCFLFQCKTVTEII